MDIKEVKDLNNWFKESDLIELAYRRGNFSVELKKEGAKPENIKISSNLVPLYSEYVGEFRFSPKGKKSKEIVPETKVKKGDVIGYVSVINKEKEIKSPVDGVIKYIGVKDRDIVEWGHLLFLIDPL